MRTYAYPHGDFGARLWLSALVRSLGARKTIGRWFLFRPLAGPPVGPDSNALGQPGLRNPYVLAPTAERSSCVRPSVR